MDWDCLVGCQGAQSQKEGQKNQGEVTELGWYLFLGPLSLPPGLPSGSGLPGNPSSYPKAFKRPLKAF